MDGPAFGAAAGGYGFPTRAAAAGVAGDPVLDPGLGAGARGTVAKGGEVVEPEAGLAFGFEARVGEADGPDGGAADVDLVAEGLPSAIGKCLTALGFSEEDRLRQRLGELGPAAEAGAAGPHPVLPGARRPGDPRAQGLESQSGAGHAGPEIVDRPNLSSRGSRCHHLRVGGGRIVFGAGRANAVRGQRFTGICSTYNACTSHAQRMH